MKQKTRWLRLDNAAKIYPAVRSETWSNVFRVSATLSEPVDIPTAQSALDVTVRRFPSLAARLRRGLFWYYLEPVEQPPEILPEYSYPLTGMHRKEMRRCALRVLVYQNRLAVELFHSLTDGNGAMIFLKTLLAEYLQQRYAVAIPATHGILDRREAPKDEELEDSFQRYAGPLQASRKSNNAWRLSGTPEKDGFKNLTCFRLDATEALRKAHEHKVSLTTFLCAVMMTALQDMQSRSVPYPMWRKSIKLHVPVDLRRMFESKSLRNFVLYATPEIQPRLGHYTFDEICKTVHHQLGVEITPKKMGMLIATNLYAEKLMAVRMMPLFLKNIAIRAVFNAVGERKSCLSLSNLGAITVPEEMKPYIRRFDFVLGVQATSPYNCGVLSYNGELCINFIRSTKEPELELAFHRALQALGLTATVQSNQPEE